MFEGQGHNLCRTPTGLFHFQDKHLKSVLSSLAQITLRLCALWNSEKAWVWGRMLALKLGSSPTGCHAPSVGPTSVSLHLIPMTFAGCRCSYRHLPPPPGPQEPSCAPGRLTLLSQDLGLLVADRIVHPWLSLLWAPQHLGCTLHCSGPPVLSISPTPLWGL